MKEQPVWYLKGFRSAKEASTLWNISKTLFQTAVFWGIFLYTIPLTLLFWEKSWGWQPYHFAGQSWLPWLLFALLGFVANWASMTMSILGKGTPLPLDHPNRLVISGPYRYVRNPMALSGLLQGACIGAYLGSILTILYIVIGGIVWDRFARPPEEHHLRLDFGEAYANYCRNVRCWIPRGRPYTV